MFGSFDHVRLGRLHQLAQQGEIVGDALILGQMLGEAARMRPASEMSLVPTETPAARAKLWMIGRSEAEASSGASSTLV